jgi:hypothetical protein
MAITKILMAREMLPYFMTMIIFSYEMLNAQSLYFLLLHCIYFLDDNDLLFVDMIHHPNVFFID